MKSTQAKLDILCAIEHLTPTEALEALATVSAGILATVHSDLRDEAAKDLAAYTSEAAERFAAMSRAQLN